MNFRLGSLRLMLAVIISGLFIIAPANSLFAQESGEGFTVSPGVLIDPVSGVAYVMSPTRQVDAVQIGDGKLLWSSSAAAKPIAIRDKRVIAQVEPAEGSSEITMVALDVDNGQAMGAGTIDLGAGVISSIDDTKEHQFLIGTETSDSTAGGIVWRYYQQKISGPNAAIAPVFERFGALSVNETASLAAIAGGGFRRESGQPPYAGARVLRPASEKPASNAIILDHDSGLRYRLDGVLVPGQVNPTGTEPSTEITAIAIPTGGLIITEGPLGDEFPPTRRISGDQFAYSTDGRHIVASKFAAKIEAVEPYRWTIYTRRTYEEVARFMAQTSITNFILSENRVLYLRQAYQRREGGELKSYPLALIARDTNSGQLVWIHPVRNTRYQGPVPVQAQ